MSNHAWSQNPEKLDIPRERNCMKQPGRTCALEYTLLRINPETLKSEILLIYSGAPMGAATVARELNGSLYLGSFTGNRIVKMPYP